MGGRQRGQKKQNQAFLTEATWQDHTAIFHSHSSAFADDSKGTRAPRKPSSKHCLPIFQTCHSLSLYRLVLHKGPPPGAVAIVVVIVPDVKRTREVVSSMSQHTHTKCITFRSHCRATSFSVGGMGFFSFSLHTLAAKNICAAYFSG